MSVLSLAWICSMFWAYAVYASCKDASVSIYWQSCVSHDEIQYACVGIIEASYGFPWTQQRTLVWAYDDDPYATFEDMAPYGFHLGEVNVKPERVPYTDTFTMIVPACYDYQCHAMWAWAMCTMIAIASSFYELWYIYYHERNYSSYDAISVVTN